MSDMLAEETLAGTAIHGRINPGIAATVVSDRVVADRVVVGTVGWDRRHPLLLHLCPTERQVLR